MPSSVSKNRAKQSTLQRRRPKKDQAAKQKKARPMLSVSSKTGDDGESGLANGERLPKTHPVFEAIGSVDELNSHLGSLRALLQSLSKTADSTTLDKRLSVLQHSLFYLGAELARSPQTEFGSKGLRQLERWVQDTQGNLKAQWHSAFLLPGGSELAARLDLARAVCRRAERRVIELAQYQELRPLLTQFLNRLSDYLYVLRVWANALESYPEELFTAEKKK